MTAPTPKSAKASSPILLPTGRLSAWLSETTLLSENPFLEDGEHLFIGARDGNLGEWYTEMAEASKRDLVLGAKALQKATRQSKRPTEFKTRVLSRIEPVERELREWVAWQTFRELEASGWLPFPLCSLRTERAVTRLVHCHYERGLPQRLSERGDVDTDRAEQKRLARVLRTSGIRGRFAWRRFRSQWERLPWPILQIDVGPVPSAPAPSNRERSGRSPDGLSAGALLEAEWYICYMEKTGRSLNGGDTAENSIGKGTTDAGSRIGGTNVGPEERRPETDSSGASNGNESGDEKTSSEESPSEEKGPASGAGAPSLPPSFIPSGEALLVSRAEWDAITKHREALSSKETRHVLEIRTSSPFSSSSAAFDLERSARRFVVERQEAPSPQFPTVRAWEVLPEGQIDWLQRSEKAMEKWRDARVKWVEAGKTVYSDGQGAGSEWDGFLILWPVDIFFGQEAMQAAGYETAARSGCYSGGESGGEDSSNAAVTGEDSSREIDVACFSDVSSEGSHESEGSPEEETISFEEPKARRVQEPELEKSSVPVGDSTERPVIRPENLDLPPMFSPKEGAPVNRQVPCSECGASPKEPCLSASGARMLNRHAARTASFGDLLLEKTDLPMDVRGRILAQRITKKEAGFLAASAAADPRAAPPTSSRWVRLRRAG